MKEISDLEVYKLSEQLGDSIFWAFDKWPDKIQRTAGYQIIRSADSITANLAEGYGRYGGADKRKFYHYARGSFEETKAWLRMLYRRQIISKEEMEMYAKLVNELGPKLNGFIRSTKNL